MTWPHIFPQRGRSRATSALLLLGLAAAAPGWADDWPQFRRDAGRSAASADRVKMPLTEIWTHESRLKNGHTSLYHAAVWRGRAYFVACDEETRYLVCTDARTGATQWKQPLAASRLEFPISDAAGPAVSESGTVFVYDWIGARPGQSQYAACAPDTQTPSSFNVRTFNAQTGAPGVRFPLAAMGANGVLSRLHLLHGEPPADQGIMPVPPTLGSNCPP